MTSGRRWRTSSYSGGSNNCVEVALLAGSTAVRDSKDPGGRHLLVSAVCWQTFLSCLKSS